MTEPSARPKGDGLPGTILQIGGAGSVIGWGVNKIEVRERTDGDGWKWRYITDDEKQKLLDALNTRATPQQSPEAAEGAGEKGSRLWRAATAVALHRPLSRQVCHVPTPLMLELLDALLYSNSAPDGVKDALLPSGTRAAEPVAWMVDGPLPMDSCEVFLIHKQALEAFNDWGKRITPLYILPVQSGAGKRE